MTTSEKFCLRWKDFQENINTAFRDLRKDCDFTDVTLACEDGHQVEAHKVILSASSPFFQNLLIRNKHPHPLIYMKGMKSDDMLAIVDFLYYGEANIYQENLNTFLNIAEDLKLKGLNGTEDGDEQRGGDGRNPQKKTYNPPVPSAGTHRNNDIFKTEIPSKNNSSTSQTNSEDHITFNMAAAFPKHEFSGDMKALDEKIESSMCRSEHMIGQDPKRMEIAYICKVCGKEGKKGNIKSHIEGIHLEGISFPCNFCKKTLTSRYSLGKHNSRFHVDSK